MLSVSLVLFYLVKRVTSLLPYSVKYLLNLISLRLLILVRLSLPAPILLAMFVISLTVDLAGHFPPLNLSMTDIVWLLVMLLPLWLLRILYLAALDANALSLWVAMVDSLLVPGDGLWTLV
jgi:hypothetical protein